MPVTITEAEIKAPWQRGGITQTTPSDRRQEMFCLCMSLFMQGIVTCGAVQDAFLWQIGMTGENLPKGGVMNYRVDGI